jgi:membrane fusion protein (multidrug efflux system)
MNVGRWFLVILACLLATAGLAYYKYQQIQAAIAFGETFPEPVEAVEYFIVRAELWQPVTDVTAEVVALQTVELSSELAGRIVEVGFAPGAAVTKNQVLLRLDTSEERAQLAAAIAETELAHLDLERNRKLIRTGAAAEEARDRARAGFDAAVAMADQLRAIIDKKTLRAPFDGVAGLHELEVGQYLDRGTAIVRLIGASDQVWVDFTLPQPLAGVEVGGRVVVSTRGSVAQSFDAEIIARDAFVNERSRNVKFRSLVDSPGQLLVPGSLVTAKVPVGEQQNVVLAPITSVRRDAFGASVYVLRPAEEGARARERAEHRAVTLGPPQQDLVIITAGLKPGDRVAANGSFKLREGVLVNAVPAGSSGAIGSSGGG